LPVDKVALYVNIGVHKDPYSDIQPVADPYNVFAVVDKNHRFAEDFEPELGIYDGFYWVADAGEAWLEMKSAAKSDGITLTLGGTYRSVPLQRWNYNRRLADGHSVAVVDRANARPGHSEHHTGTTADLRGLMDFTGTKAQLWLAENGHKYGFIVSFQNSNGFITNYVAESWHIRWFPQWAAEIMYNENLTIMEFDNLYLNPASHGYSIDIDSVKRAVAAFGAAIDD
jgi:D-alanyl-D-alanine carboxypeptidase